MNLLLDTHTFLWFSNGDVQLSATARQLIEDSENTKYVSAASLWEIAIKISTDKLRVGLSITEIENEYIKANALIVLPILPRHLDIVATLPFHHRDPFDRLLIAQAIADNYTLISRDALFANYPVKYLW